MIIKQNMLRGSHSEFPPAVGKFSSPGLTHIYFRIYHIEVIFKFPECVCCIRCCSVHFALWELVCRCEDRTEGDQREDEDEREDGDTAPMSRVGIWEVKGWRPWKDDPHGV